MSLRAEVYVAPPIPFKKPNGQIGGTWSPISCTLIHSPTSAVLVDTPITISQTTALADWIEQRVPGKNLTHIYITHGHGDHFFGLPILFARFPGVQAVATPAVIEHMKQQVESKVFAQTWGSQFPDQIAQPFALEKVTPVPASKEIKLDGHVLQVVEVGQADTHDSTVLWVPSLKLAVCGDVVYGDVHQMLGECDTRAKRMLWVASIDRVAQLGPEVVVPGHKREGEIDGVWHLKETREYILAFQGFLDAGAGDTRELVAKMKGRYPGRFNEGALLVGAVSAFRARKKDVTTAGVKL